MELYVHILTSNSQILWLSMLFSVFTKVNQKWRTAKILENNKYPRWNIYQITFEEMNKEWLSNTLKDGFIDIWMEGWIESKLMCTCSIEHCPSEPTDSTPKNYEEKEESKHPLWLSKHKRVPDINT